MFRTKRSVALVLSLATAFAISANLALAGAHDPDPKFDRLDGTGKSGKRVDVIEWEGNLEIHVYPAGSLKGLALKLDKKPGSKEKVMVIGYRFDTQPAEQLVRRAILGIDLREGFNVYRDPTADEYDKVVISNNGLAKPMVAFRTEGEPKQLYPDGHPALAQGAEEDNESAREPAAASSKRDLAKARAKKRVVKAAEEDESAEEEADLSASDEDEGRIKPFFIKRKSNQGRTVRGGKFDP